MAEVTCSLRLSHRPPLEGWWLPAHPRAAVTVGSHPQSRVFLKRSPLISGPGPGSQPRPAGTLPSTEIGKKHQGTLTIVSEKQHLRAAHSWGLMPGYPQFLRADTCMTHSSNSGRGNTEAQ